MSRASQTPMLRRIACALALGVTLASIAGCGVEVGADYPGVAYDDLPTGCVHRHDDARVLRGARHVLVRRSLELPGRQSLGPLRPGAARALPAQDAGAAGATSVRGAQGACRGETGRSSLIGRSHSRTSFLAEVPSCAGGEVGVHSMSVKPTVPHRLLSSFDTWHVSCSMLSRTWTSPIRSPVRCAPRRWRVPARGEVSPSRPTPKPGARGLPLAAEARDVDRRHRPIYAVWEITLALRSRVPPLRLARGRGAPRRADDRRGARSRRPDGRPRRARRSRSSAARRTCAKTGSTSSARSGRAG